MNSSAPAAPVFAPLPPELAERLVRQYLPEPADPRAVADVLAAVTGATLEVGTVLIHADEPVTDLYLVLRGGLAVHIDHPGQAPTVVETIGVGGVAGELALLSGPRRSATVVVAESSDVARLSRPDFERLAARHPQALQAFFERIVPRLQRNQVVRMLAEVFGDFDVHELPALEPNLAWTVLDGGSVLFRAGDPGDALYVVVNGRLRVVTHDADGSERVLEEVGRGGAVGELALVTGEPRAATVYAVRDTVLVRLARPLFDLLAEHHPRAMLQIARASAVRLQRSTRGPARVQAPATVFAVVGDGASAAAGDAPVAALAQQLAATLAETGRCLHLSSGRVDALLGSPGVAQCAPGSAAHDSMLAWLSGLERDHRYVVLEADPAMTAWTLRCLRQADRVLVTVAATGTATAAPTSTGPLEQAIATAAPKARRELVLVHADSVARPVATAAWLAARDVAAHHHVRLGNRADLRRLARRATGTAHGLVLGGGGARGFVHIGVLRALAEAGIEIDVVGGTSFGALIAAAYAMGYSLDEMQALARTLASPQKLLDRTLPIVALMAGRKVTRVYQQLFGETLAEDLWLPCFAISSDLTRAAAVIHRTGPLWEAVRASTALPAIFPPLLHDAGAVLVDGGVMNNMPLDVMRELCPAGSVIGVNPMPVRDRPRDYRFGSSVSGFDALLGRLRLFGVRTRAPSILGSVMRATEINSANRMRQPAYRALADLLIEPPVETIPILAFDRYAEIIEIGYRSAREQLAGWPTGTTRREP